MPAALYSCPNGLTVVLQENHAAKVVAFQAWVSVGSADEPPELAGIAHVFEHMLFKGTKKRGVGQIAREVEAAGGDINAWTSFDQTVYHLVLASRFYETGLDILADALQNSSFDPEELDKELKVVLEEVKQGEDNPSRVATQALFATAYHAPSLSPAGHRLHQDGQVVHARAAARLLPSLVRRQQRHAGHRRRLRRARKKLQAKTHRRGAFGKMVACGRWRAPSRKEPAQKRRARKVVTPGRARGAGGRRVPHPRHPSRRRAARSICWPSSSGRAIRRG